jgi:hypothetical protein
VGIYVHSDDSVTISLDTRDNNIVDDMEPNLQEPLKLIVVHEENCCSSIW